MRTLMDKINHFESQRSQTVKDFNEIFTNAPLNDVAPHLEVEIGELDGSDTTRILTVGTLLVKHSFVPASESESKEYKRQQREDQDE